MDVLVAAHAAAIESHPGWHSPGGLAFNDRGRDAQLRPMAGFAPGLPVCSLQRPSGALVVEPARAALAPCHQRELAAERVARVREVRARAGLDLEAVLRSVGSGAAGSWSLANLAPRMLKNDFAPGFFVEHFVKDMGLVTDAARASSYPAPLPSAAEQLYLAGRRAGLGRRDDSAVIEVLRGAH